MAEVGTTMTETPHGGTAVTDTILHLLTTMQDQLNRMEGKLESPTGPGYIIKT